MAGNLMALGNHALDNISIRYINHALADIVTSNKEGSNSTVSLEGVQHGCSV